MRIAVVGATGAVGEELLALLADRDVPAERVRAFASARSAGRSIPYAGRALEVAPLPEGGDLGAELVFSSAGGTVARREARRWVAHGSVVIDNTSAWRMDPDVPLVIPEVNGEAADRHDGVVANPNCSTILALMALAPLHRAWGLERITVATYQAVSGAGAKGVAELTRMTRAALDGTPAEPEAFAENVAFNLFSHDSPVGDDGYNVEERKLADESRKILDLPELAVSATCVRVPVYRAHAEAIHAAFREPADPDEARRLLEGAPGVRVVDDRAAGRFPTPMAASGRDEVLVGRIRADLARPGGLALFLAGDQIRKGAALNAVQIAERLAPGLGS